MAIRVLGYKSVVEAKGTWPTNYIAKAQELKVLKDVEYKSYSDGAVRGNVALVIWNMLRTYMWDVNSESEKDGLTYGESGLTMIDKYFADYEYIDENAEYVVTSITVDDGKVTVDLESEEKADRYDIELGKNTDFLNLLGRKVSGLYNKEDKEMVVIVPSTEDKIKADYREELEEDYKFTKVEDTLTWGKNSAFTDDNNYTVAVIGTGKYVDYTTDYNTADSYVVKETKMNKDVLKITTVEDATKKITEENAIVLIDGEWATREDIEAGDVVTVLIENELYVVNRDQITGSFDDAAADFVKVDGKKYEYLLTNKLFEIDDEGEEISKPEFDSLDKDSKYFDEDCTVYVNFLGEVVRVEFEEIKDEDDGNFYILTNVPGTWEDSDKSGTARYIELNGEDYEVKTTADKLVNFDYDTLVAGSIVFAKFDNRDRVVEIKLIQAVSGNEFSGEATTEVVDEEYEFEKLNAELEDNYVGTYKISTSTTVYTITPVEDEDDDIVGYEVEITKGQSALKGIEESVIAHKEGSKVASYAFVLEDAKNTDIEYGIIDEDGVQSGKKTQQVSIDGKVYTVDEDETRVLSTSDEGKVIAFIDDKDGIRIKDLYATSEVSVDAVTGRIVIDEEDSRIFKVSGDPVTISGDLDDDKYEDTTFVVINYDMDDDEFTSVDTYTAKDVSLDDDYIYVGARNGIKDTIFIVKGYEYDYVGNDVEDPVVDDTTTKYTIRFYVDEKLFKTVTANENTTPRVDKPAKAAADDGTTYKFLGWTTEDAPETVLDAIPVATEDANYYAKFEVVLP